MVSNIAVVLNDSISVAESAAQGLYRHTSTPIIIPIIDMHDRQSNQRLQFRREINYEYI